jgi:two-component system LytT family response regulator
MIRALIVDDEAPARAKLKRLLAREGDVELVGEARNGLEAVALIREAAPDVVFLDVQMPECDGFGVIEQLGAGEMPVVVFVTAFDEHAVRAFEVQALDYLLKPAAPERFRQVMERVRAQRANAADGNAATKLARLLDELAPPGRYLSRVLVHKDGKAFLVPTAQIDRVESDRNYVRLHVGQNSFSLRSTLSAFAERLDPGQFLRINRSELVRMDAIKVMHPWFHGDYQVVLHDGTTRMWSRRFRANQQGTFGD